MDQKNAARADGELGVTCKEGRIHSFSQVLGLSESQMPTENQSAGTSRLDPLQEGGKKVVGRTF